MRKLAGALVLIWLLSGCIGTDVVDDPVVGESLEIFPDRIALLIGNSTMATATYYDQFGIAKEVDLEWNAEPAAIATVDQNGVVTGVAPGQAQLFVIYQGLIDSVRIAVVVDENAAASVDLSSANTSLDIGETALLTAVVKNIDDETITSSTLTWHSSNESVLTVSSDGVALAISSGAAAVYAMADGVFSNEIHFMVGGGIRMGTFVSANGYQASGTAILNNTSGDLILMFNENFMTSFALGTFIYLSNNNTSGTTIRAQGIELGEITANGSHMFNVTQKFPTATLEQYQYVIVLCKPATLVFGYAELNP